MTLWQAPGKLQEALIIVLQPQVHSPLTPPPRPPLRQAGVTWANDVDVMHYCDTTTTVIPHVNPAAAIVSAADLTPALCKRRSHGHSFTQCWSAAQFPVNPQLCSPYFDLCLLAPMIGMHTLLTRRAKPNPHPPSRPGNTTACHNTTSSSPFHPVCPCQPQSLLLTT